MKQEAEPSTAKQVLPLVPLSVLPAVNPKRCRGGELQAAQHCENDAAKTVPWPGATPFWAPFGVPKPLRAVGGRSRPRAPVALAESAGLPRR